MPRGMVPRQPARTGRQDKVRVGRTLLSAQLPPQLSRKTLSASPTYSQARLNSSGSNEKPRQEVDGAKPQQVSAQRTSRRLPGFRAILPR